jgi:hypothetical protein
MSEDSPSGCEQVNLHKGLTRNNDTVDERWQLMHGGAMLASQSFQNRHGRGA